MRVYEGQNWPRAPANIIFLSKMHAIRYSGSAHRTGDWYSGSTLVSKTSDEGSIPSSPAMIRDRFLKKVKQYLEQKVADTNRWFFVNMIIMKEEIPYFEDESSKLHPGLPIIERETVNAILWNPETNEILCLDWEKFGWKTFIIGGVEDGEDPEVTAKREVEEETGYLNLEFLTNLGRIRSAYFATHKNQNRIANTTGFLLKLKNTEQKQVHTADLPHIFKWIPKKDVELYINLSSQRYLWKKALETNYLN